MRPKCFGFPLTEGIGGFLARMAFVDSGFSG